MASSNNIGIENSCRTCLSKESNMFSIFEIRLGMETLDKVITSITGIKIAQGDGLPSTICNGCKEKASIAHNFRTRSLEAEHTLRGSVIENVPLNENNLVRQATSVEVKIERLVQYTFDDYVDLNLSLAVGDVEETFNDEAQENTDNSDMYCPVCGSEFSDAEGLSKHLSEQHGDLLGPRKRGRPKKLLTSMILNKLSEKGYDCIFCKENFKSKRDLLSHTIQHKAQENTDNSDTYCPVCGSEFSDAEGLSKHLSEQHGDLLGPRKRGRPKKLLTSMILNKLSEKGHDCIFCKENFKSKRDLLSHTIQHKAEKNKYKNITNCPVCGWDFSDGESLTKHVWAEHRDIMGPRKRGRPKKLLTNMILNKLSEKGHDCIFCKENFKSKRDLLSHTIQHKDVKIFNCLMCERMFLKKIDIEQHQCLEIPNDHIKQGEPPDVQGTNSNIKLFKVTLLEDILITNGEMEIESMEQCEECEEIFKCRTDLTKHRDRNHPELSSRCYFCNKVFASVQSAARHRSVCSLAERLFACSICDLRFTRELSLNKHILRAHAGQSVSVRFMDRDRTRKHICDTCNKGFYRKDLLASHLKIHNEMEKCFECDVCKKKFSRKDNLKCHLMVHNGDSQRPKNSLCLYCGRSFSNSSNLIVHMRRHTGEKPYKCDFCDKGFPRSSDLQCHRRSHTGEKPCICSVCGKGFSRSNKLSRHMRIHTGVKPYKCSYCEKTFAQSNDRTLHVRRHTGDKPYVCELCGDRFIHSTALHNHRRVHGHHPPAAPLVYGVQTVPQAH